VLDEGRKQELIRRFDKLPERRETWINKNRYYYEDQAGYYRFLVPEGLSARLRREFIQAVEIPLNPVARSLAFLLFILLEKRRE
jgi:hypothetical protein